MSSRLTFYQVKLRLNEFTNLKTNFPVFGAGEWSHRENRPGLFGPSQWGNVSAVCNGQRQSPIDIVTFSARLPPSIFFSCIKIRGHEKIPTSITYTNDGHGFSAKFTFNDGVQPSITGGPMGSDIFGLDNVHMHWPSEHTINGRYADAEVHLVHWNLKYGSIGEAASKSDGLAVVGVLLNVRKLEN